MELDRSCGELIRHTYKRSAETGSRCAAISICAVITNEIGMIKEIHDLNAWFNSQVFVESDGAFDQRRKIVNWHTAPRISADHHPIDNRPVGRRPGVSAVVDTSYDVVGQP